MAYWPSSAATMSLPTGCWVVRKMPIFMPTSDESTDPERAETLERQRRGRVAPARRRRVARRSIGVRLIRPHRRVGLLVAHLDGELRLGIGHGAIVGADRDLAVVEP